MRPLSEDGGISSGRLTPRVVGGILQSLPCYHPPVTEILTDQLDRLKQRRDDLKTAIAAKKREVVQLQKKRSQALEHQLRRDATAQQRSRYKKGPRSVHEHGPDRKFKS